MTTATTRRLGSNDQLMIHLMSGVATDLGLTLQEQVKLFGSPWLATDPELEGNPDYMELQLELRPSPDIRDRYELFEKILGKLEVVTGGAEKIRAWINESHPTLEAPFRTLLVTGKMEDLQRACDLIGA